jgi:hypothetical protein
MNEHFKIDEAVEYHIEDILGEYEPFITSDYNDAKQSFQEGDFVTEHRFYKHSSEWMKCDQHIAYEWHQ